MEFAFCVMIGTARRSGGRPDARLREPASGLFEAACAPWYQWYATQSTAGPPLRRRRSAVCQTH